MSWTHLVKLREPNNQTSDSGTAWASEVRATYGGLFISAGAAVVVITRSDAALVLGAAWTGVFVDSYRTPK
jgi:3-oxoacyl-(acyl-carrier-protein) synthase